MAIKYFNKSVFLATIICIVFFYLNKESFIRNEKLTSLLDSDDIVYLKGEISSSPFKIATGQYYCCSFAPYIIKNQNDITTSAKGIIKIYIPCSIVEAYFPGKLFTLTKHDETNLFEIGGIYAFTGKSYNNSFFVDNCIESFWNDSFLGRIAYFRALCRLRFKRLMYGWNEGGGLLLSLLSGAKEYTDIEISELFRNAGLSHILALSGMHLSIFSAIAFLISKKSRSKKIGFLIRIIFLTIFVWFTGFSPSLLRAFTCTLAIIIASMAGSRQLDMVMILCFSFLLQSVLCPEDIYNISFMLSYSAFAGILLLGKLLNIFLIRFFPLKLASSLSASLGAQITTAPIMLKNFGVFYPIGTIATIIISPFIIFFIYSGLILIVATMIFPILQNASGFFINLQYNVIRYLVIFFSQAPIWSLN